MTDGAGDLKVSQPAGGIAGHLSVGHRLIPCADTCENDPSPPHFFSDFFQAHIYVSFFLISLITDKKFLSRVTSSSQIPSVVRL
jgi:hypothetical protein